MEAILVGIKKKTGKKRQQQSLKNEGVILAHENKVYWNSERKQHTISMGKGGSWNEVNKYLLV